MGTTDTYVIENQQREEVSRLEAAGLREAIDAYAWMTDADPEDTAQVMGGRTEGPYPRTGQHWMARRTVGSERVMPDGAIRFRIGRKEDRSSSSFGPWLFVRAVG